MGNVFIITAENVAAIDKAIHALRDRIKAGESRTKQSREEDMDVLAGLLCIFPKQESMWSPGPEAA